MKNRNGKHTRKADPLATGTAEMIVPPFVPALGQVETVSNAAIEWAMECGLSMPLGAAVEVREYGFQVQVTEISGKQRCANARFNRQGQRQMYERAK